MNAMTDAILDQEAGTDVTNDVTGNRAPERRPKPRLRYNPELGVKLCERIALREPLAKICAEDDMPCETTVYKWRLEHYDFAKNYARAREHRAESRSDRIDDYIELVRTGKLDANSARVMIDAEKWQASKELPKVYGDRISAEVTGPDGGPLRIEAAAAVRALLEAMPELGVLPALALSVPSAVAARVGGLASAGPPSDGEDGQS